MNKKGINGLLIVVVLIIWGLIFYRLFNSFFAEPSENIPTQTNQKKIIAEIERKDFILRADYRDPFLGKMFKEAVKPKMQNIAIPKKVVKEEKPVTEIKFLGMIKNKTSNKGIALVSINGEDKMAAEGEERVGVKFIKITSDSVRVICQGKSCWVRKN